MICRTQTDHGMSQSVREEQTVSGEETAFYDGFSRGGVRSEMTYGALTSSWTPSELNVRVQSPSLVIRFTRGLVPVSASQFFYLR